MKPIVGIILDWQEKGSFSNYNHYALRKNYFDAIEKAGGIAIGISYSDNFDFLDVVDGILSPGGEESCPKELYQGYSDSPYLETIRTKFEIKLIKEILKRDMPFLGICQGMQFLAAVNSCKMSGDIIKDLNAKDFHKKQHSEFAHKITVKKDSLLFDIIKKEEFQVNSWHREGVAEASDSVMVSATSEDGIIEAIEAKGKRFALGLQWHPEFLVSNEDKAIFAKFVKACCE